MNKNLNIIDYAFQRKHLQLLAIFFVFYFFKLSNYGQSIDDELAATRGSAVIWLTQGRWGAYLFETLVLPNPAIPFVSTLVFGVFLVLAYPVFLSAFDITAMEPVHYATFPIFAAFPTWAFLTAFSANTGAAGLGMLLVAWAVWLFSRMRGGCTRQNAIFLFYASLCVATAISIYQAYLFSVVVGVTALVMKSVIEKGDEFLKTVRSLMGLLLLLSMGYIVYKTIDIAFLKIYGVESSGYTRQFFDLKYLAENIQKATVETLKAAVFIYAGSSKYYGAQIYAFPMLICVGVLSLFVGRRQSLGQKGVVLVLGLIILLTPFLLIMVSGETTLRALVAVPLAVWIFAMVGLRSNRSWLRSMAGAVLIYALFGIYHSIGAIQAADSYVKSHDRILAAEIYRQIANVNSDFDRNRSYAVDFYGAKDFVSLYRRSPTSTLGYSFFEWDGGNPWRILAHMRALGYSNLQLVDLEKRRRNLRDFEQMPIWPANGAVRIVDGVTLVKLGGSAGSPFNR